MPDLIAEIKALCQRYNSPAVNIGAHALAARILKLIEDAEKREAGKVDA